MDIKCRYLHITQAKQFLSQKQLLHMLFHIHLPHILILIVAIVSLTFDTIIEHNYINVKNSIALIIYKKI